MPNEEGLRNLGASASRPSADRPVPNEGGLRHLGDRIDRERATGSRTRRSGRARWSTRRKVLTVLTVIVALALVLAGAGYGYLRYRYGQLSKIHVAAEKAEISGQPFNMLVVGSDSRVGTDNPAFGSSAQVTGQRSDVVMVWHVDPATKQITILSIPRDTVLQMIGSDVNQFGQFNRINAAYNTGINQLVATIQSNFGIPINHTMQVDFGGFQGAVNALGGVWMDFNYPARDAFSGLNVTQTGCQLLNGQEALSVARSRHYEYFANGVWNGDGSSDFGRITRQDAFLRALIDSAKSKYNPLTINAFLGSIPQGLVIDDQLGLNEILGLATAFHSLNPNAIVTETLPTTGAVDSLGDVLFVNQPAAQQMLVSIFGNQLTNPPTPPPDSSFTPQPTPSVTPAAPVSATNGSAAGDTAALEVQSATTTPAPNAPPSFDPTACSPR